MPSTLSKIQGCLMGVAIGDAMGMPWETMTPEEIKTETGDRGVQGFSAPVQKRISGTASHNAGDTTDDWQLTHAIARSLIRQKKFDIEDIAREHVVEFDRSVKGWGGTTKTSVRKIKEWFETSGKRGINPSNPAHIHRVGQGSGNGVAMKVAPLGIFFNHDDDALCNAVWSVGALTHTDDRAWITAYLTAYVISTSLYG